MRSELGLAYAGVRVRQGEFADGAAWCRRVLDEALPDDLQAIAHAYYLMHLAYISNRSPERAALRGVALPIYAELGDLLGQANVLNNAGAPTASQYFGVTGKVVRGNFLQTFNRFGLQAVGYPLSDEQQEMIRIDRFLQEIMRAIFHRLHSFVN